MGAIAPLAYFLQTVTPLSPTTSTTSYNPEKVSIENHTEKDQEQHLESQSKQNKVDDIVENCEAPDIKSALKEAFTSPTFLMITLGFSVCGFHVTFLATHFPAYLVNIIACFINFELVFNCLI